MKMKGHATIQLFDAKTKKEVKRIEEHNLVTNFFKEFYRQLYVANPLVLESELFSNAVRYSTINRLLGDGGILLYEEPKEENPNIITSAKTPFAYAGSNYNNTDPTRGSLNTNETANISKDGKVIGKKFVWDFPTSCANGTFQNICLTNSHFGNKVKSGIRLSQMAYNSNNNYDANGFKMIHNSVYNNIYKMKYSFGYNGEIYYSDNNKIKIFINCKNHNIYNQIATNITKLTPDDVITLEGYEKLCKVIDDHVENIYITCGYNLETDKWDIIKINKDTKEISSTIELTNIQVTTNQRIAEIYDFGITKGIIYYNPPFYKGNNYSNLSRYDFINQEQLSDITGMSVSSNESYSSYEHSYISTIKEEEDYYCHLCYQTCYSSTSSGYSVLFYGKNTIYKNDNYLAGSNNSILPYKLLINYGVLPFGLTSTRFLEALGAGVAWQPLYTINNLTNPVEKTEGNTMKITYTIMWDS